MGSRKSLLVQLVPWTSTSLLVRLAHAVSTEQFTPIQQRAAAALLGAIVGDAAAQTSHWNYDRAAFHAKLRSEGRHETPEFFRSNGFYTVTPGRNSCYGDQIIAIAEHLVNNPKDPFGQTNTAKLVDKLEATFDGASAYGPWPLDPEAPKPTMPIAGPWRHGSLKGFLDNLRAGKREVPECGSDDFQADCFAKAIPCVALYAGHPELLAFVETAVRSTQNTAEAVAFAQAAAKVLEVCVLGHANDVASAIELASAALQARPLRPGVLSPLQALELVLEICGMGPPSFESAVDVLGAHPMMKPNLKSPVSLVA